MDDAASADALIRVKLQAHPAVIGHIVCAGVFPPGPARAPSRVHPIGLVNNEGRCGGHKWNKLGGLLSNAFDAAFLLLLI
ncbi:unnamed protein product [Colias eurytheme]|nr:unnamed protein product [Colias eurytheme]